jgi:hypothetical protein
VDEVGDEFLARPRLALYEHGGRRVGDVQSEFDGAADGRGLADDAVFGPPLQLAPQPHHLRRELVAFERRAELDGDALD